MSWNERGKQERERVMIKEGKEEPPLGDWLYGLNDNKKKQHSKKASHAKLNALLMWTCTHSWAY